MEENKDLEKNLVENSLEEKVNTEDESSNLNNDNNELVLEEDEAKTLSRKEKRREKIIKRYTNPIDIKYKGPLSYRYLRIIAWLSFAVGQMVLLASIASTILKWDSLGQFGRPIAETFAELATPLFIVASFGLVLSGKKSHKGLIFLYGACYFSLAIGLSILYSRYIDGLFTKIGLTETGLVDITQDFIKSKIQINVFSDLFAFSLFNLFINYTPKKIFNGKKLIIFRLFAIIPVTFVIVSYILKVLFGLGLIDISVYGFLFMSTKSPFVFFVFITASLWIKNRERIFLKLGGTKTEYNNYLKTNRNSLSFSLHLSFIIIAFAIIEFFVYIYLLIFYTFVLEAEAEVFFSALPIYGVGQTFSLLLSIPFIMLYSYTRNHDESKYDILVPIIGVGLCAFAYVEGIYQIVVRLLG